MPPITDPKNREFTSQPAFTSKEISRIMTRPDLEISAALKPGERPKRVRNIARPVLDGSDTAATSLASARKKFLDVLGGQVAGETEEQARERLRQGAQGSVDVVNQAALMQLRRLEEQTAGALGGQRARLARTGGLGTSERGAAPLQDIRTRGREEAAGIEAERSAGIEGVFDRIDVRVQEEQERKRTRALQESGTRLEFAQEDVAKEKEESEARKADAIRDIGILAQSGVELDEISDEQYSALFEQSGFSDQITFDSFYNGQRPKAQQITYKYHNLGNGVVLRTGVKADGTPVQEEELDFSVPPDFKLQELDDGTLVLLNPATGEVKIAGGTTQGQFAKPKSEGGDTVSERKQAAKNAVIDSARSELEANRGTDGFVDPGIYSRQRTEFVQAGGTTSEFDNLFANQLSQKERNALNVGKTTPPEDEGKAEQSRNFIQQYKDSNVSKKEVKKIVNDASDVDKPFWEKAFKEIYGE